MNLKTMPMEQRMLLVLGGIIGFVLTVLVVAAFMPTDYTAVQAREEAELKAQIEQDAAFEAARKSVPFVPFPDAAEVRLVYHDMSVSIDKAGQANEGALRPIVLNASQAEIARASFMWKTPPAYMAACCIPRHAFTFYNDRGAFLGSVTFCLECGCTETNGVTAPAGMDWIEWDEPKLVGLIRSLGVEARTH
jgi:hypothetical protein